MCVIEEKVEKLLNGIDGQEIICELREHYASSFWSFKTAVSKIRQNYMKYNRRHPQFLFDMNAVEAKTGEILNQEEFDMFLEKIGNFKNCSLNEQYDILRLGHIHKSKRIQNLFKEIRLLPDNMRVQSKMLHEMARDFPQAYMAIRRATLIQASPAPSFQCRGARRYTCRGV